MGVPPAEQCGESEGVCTNPTANFVIGIEEHPKNACAAQSLYKGDRSPSTSWFVCENQSQLRNMGEGLSNAYKHNLFRRIASVEKPINSEVHKKCEFQLEEGPSVEDQNNMEASSTPVTQVDLKLNEISIIDQKVASSVQLNDIEAKCNHQQTLESVLKVAHVQELFKRKLSKTWKEECNTYDENIPSLSPRGDQSQNFASSGVVKAILTPSRKKWNMTLDVSSIANCENPCPNVNVDSLEIQESQDEDCSSPEDAVVTVKNCCKGKAISEQHQKVVVGLRSKPTKKRQNKKKRQQGQKESPMPQSKKIKEDQKKNQTKMEQTEHQHPSSVGKKKQKKQQRKNRRSSRLRGDRDSCSPQAIKSEEQGTSLEQRHMSDSGIGDEPSDADSSTPQQWHSASPPKQGNGSSGNWHSKGAGRGFCKDDGGVGEETGDKDDDEEQPPGKDGETHIDITALQQTDARERRHPGHLDFRVLRQEMPPEVLRDETGDQAPSDFNVKPPPPPDQLSASTSASASGVGGNTDAALLSDPRKKLQVPYHQRLGLDSGFSSGLSPQVQLQPVEPLQQDTLDIPRRKPVWIACPKSSRFHPMVSESHGTVGRESATGDQSAVTTDATFAPGLQQFAPIHSCLPKTKSDVGPPYNSLEYFDRENQQQDNVLGSSCTPFISTAEQHLGGHVVHHAQRPCSAHGDQDVDSVEGLLDFQQYPTQESGSQCIERVEMVGCIAPFLPTGVVCSPPSQHAHERTTVDPVNSPTALSHANFESRIVGILSSPDLYTFTPQSDMFVPSIEPLVS